MQYSIWWSIRNYLRPHWELLQGGLSMSAFLLLSTLPMIFAQWTAGHINQQKFKQYMNNNNTTTQFLCSFTVTSELGIKAPFYLLSSRRFAYDFIIIQMHNSIHSNMH